jgi:hypothetical protein
MGNALTETEKVGDLWWKCDSLSSKFRSDKAVVTGCFSCIEAKGSARYPLEETLFSDGQEWSSLYPCTPASCVLKYAKECIKSDHSIIQNTEGNSSGKD